MNFNLDYKPQHDEPYDENKVYVEYIVREDQWDHSFGVLRRNTITGHSTGVANYTDGQLANHIAWTLNQHVQSERK